MRILRVAQKAYPDATGGGAYHVHALSRDQAAAGHEVTVLTVGGAPNLERRAGYTVVSYPAVAAPLGNAVAPGVWRHLNAAAGDADVVHAHSHLYASTALAALARRIDGTPLAVTNHGLYSQSAPRWLFDAYLRTLGRATLDAADVVFCYTATDRDRLRDLGVGTDVAVVPNGIDCGRFVPDGPADGAVRGDPAVLFVGRLVGGKRPGDAVAALERLRGSFPAARLTLAGDGPLRPDLERRVADAGLGDAVSFLGHVAYDRMPAVYRAADLLVLPSVAEGFPRTVLEALATGTPAVATALDQLEAVEGRGIRTVPAADVPALASAVEGLAGDPQLRRALGRRGRSLIEDRHDWADTVQKTTARLAALAE